MNTSRMRFVAVATALLAFMAMDNPSRLDADDSEAPPAEASGAPAEGQEVPDASAEPGVSPSPESAQEEDANAECFQGPEEGVLRRFEKEREQQFPLMPQTKHPFAHGAPIRFLVQWIKGRGPIHVGGEQVDPCEGTATFRMVELQSPHVAGYTYPSATEVLFENRNVSTQVEIYILKD